MILANFLFALIIAIIIGAIFSFGFKRSGPWGAWWIFFILLFFAAWAATFWIVPAGPVYYGFGWIPVIFFVFLFALLIAAAAGSASDDTIQRSSDELISEDTGTTLPKGEVRANTYGFDYFFWVLLVFLIIAIIIGIAR